MEDPYIRIATAILMQACVDSHSKCKKTRANAILWLWCNGDDWVDCIAVLADKDCECANEVINLWRTMKEKL